MLAMARKISSLYTCVSYLVDSVCRVAVHARPPHLAQISGRYLTAELPPAYCVLRRHVSDDGVALS